MTVLPTCKACGHQRQESDPGAIGVCPKCNMPYSWLDASHANTKQPKSHPTPPTVTAKPAPTVVPTPAPRPVSRVPETTPAPDSPALQTPMTTQPTTSNGMTEAVAGAGLMIFGCFMPIISAPFVGTVNYVGQGNRDGMFIIALALVGLFLAYTGRMKRLVITGGIAALIMLYDLANFAGFAHDMKAQKDALKGNPFGGLAAAMMDSIQLQWGWILLLGGAGLTIATGLGIRLKRP